jgi:outer membrane protein OmpA-like peptidoglycan-associated protein
MEAPPAVEPPPADVVAPPPAEPPPAGEVAPPADAPPAVEPPPVIDLLPPPTETVQEPPPPPPPPPPPAEEGEFNLQRFEVKPDFGATAPEAATPPAPLPQAAEQVQEGAALPAQDGRVIVKNQGQVTVIHDDSRRFRQRGDDVRSERTDNDTETTTIRRPDGTEIVTVRDRWGNIVQRYVKAPDGSVRILIGQVEDPGFFGRVFGRGQMPAPPPPPRPPAPINLQLGPLTVTIPQEQYIVETSRADRQQLEQTLIAPPVEVVERPYSLEEIRRSGRLRDKVRRIDFDTITFDTGQATVPESEIGQMQAIGYALRDVIQQDPTQVFLIEGHTDAVGSDLSNLALSDRRAETVAEILSYYFGIPPENLVTQGYGEQFLKIPTVAAERENRRVAFRNITYLLRADAQ